MLYQLSYASPNSLVQTIGTQPGEYATDADSLVALKQAGVSDRVITAMVNKGRIRLTGAETPIVLSDVNEIGVYYKDRSGKWQAIEPEIVHIKSGGFIKSTITHGIIKRTGTAMSTDANRSCCCRGPSSS
jgi:hypothetical protein